MRHRWRNQKQMSQRVVECFENGNSLARNFKGQRGATQRIPNRPCAWHWAWARACADDARATQNANCTRRWRVNCNGGTAHSRHAPAQSTRNYANRSIHCAPQIRACTHCVVRLRPDDGFVAIGDANFFFEAQIALSLRSARCLNKLATWLMDGRSAMVLKKWQLSCAGKGKKAGREESQIEPAPGIRRGHCETHADIARTQSIHVRRRAREQKGKPLCRRHAQPFRPPLHSAPQIRICTRARAVGRWRRGQIGVLTSLGDAGCQFANVG